LVFNVIKLSGKDWYDKIRLQQPDPIAKDTVTVDEIDVSRLPTPKKRSIEQNPGPNELTRTTSPILYSLDTNAWKATVLAAPLPINCKWDKWNPWSNCMCDGTRTRDRTLTEEQFGGKPCNDTQGSQSETCTTGRVCDCSWLDWGAWTQCSATCGVGQQTRTRSFLPPQGGGALCSGNSSVTGFCKIMECQSDCIWQEWGYWSDCALLDGESCGWGVQKRMRGFIPAANGGISCDDQDQMELLDCEMPCAAPQPESTGFSNISDVGVDNREIGLTVVFAIFLALVVISLIVAIVLAFKAISNPPSSSGGDGYQAY